MSFIRITYKLLALIFMSIKGMVMMFLLSFTGENSGLNEKQKEYRKQWLNTVTRILSLKIEIKGHNKCDEKQNSLWVANHISWLDIVTIGSFGTTFLSKAEIRSWPLIGWLGEQAGTVFIQRGGINAAQQASQKIAETIKSDDNVLVFPEATTGVGDRVKPFHARIFASALDHQLTVQAIAIQYLDEYGENHPKVTWVHQGFINNMLGVLAQKNIKVVVTFLPVIDTKQFTERKRLAEFAENQIRHVIEASS